MSRFFDLLVANEIYADIDLIMSPQEDGKTESFYLSGTLTSLIVDWGDGTQTTASTTNSHTYTSAGDYRVRVLGDCRGVTNVRFGGTDTTTTYDVTLVNKLHLPNAGGDGVYMSLFRECRRLTSVRRMYLPKATNLFASFYRCYALTHLGDDTVLPSYQSEYSSNIFYYCTSLTHLPPCFGNMEIRCGYFFIAGCSALTSLPDGINFANATRLESCFNNCSSLVWTPTASDFWERTSPQVKYNGRTFQGCTSMPNYADIPTAWKDGSGTVLYQPPNE